MARSLLTCISDAFFRYADARLGLFMVQPAVFFHVGLLKRFRRPLIFLWQRGLGRFRLRSPDLNLLGQRRVVKLRLNKANIDLADEQLRRQALT